MQRFLGVLGCALLAYVVLFWRLGDASFWDPDEAHYAETTRELIASGDYLAPTYNEEPYFEKPVFFHWLQSIPMRMAGPTEGAARAVPALAALLLVVMTWWVGTQLAGVAVGRLAALLLLVNPGVFALARYAILDSLLTAFLFGGVSLVAASALNARPRLQYPGYVLIGLATFVKGPIAIILCGVALVIAALVSPEARRQLLRLRYVRGLMIVFAIAAPWFVLMLRRFGGAFVEGYFLSENLRLFTIPLYSNQPGWWFYPVIVFTGLLPWTWIIVGRVYDQARALVAERRAPDVVDILLWAWVVAVVGFFSFSRFKLDHYAFPAAPALCLICARAWHAVRLEPPESTRGARLGVHLVGPTIAAAGVVVAVLAIRVLALPSAFLLAPGLLVALGLAATIRYAAPVRRLPATPALGLLALGVVYAGALVWVMPQLERDKVVPEVARWVQARAAPTDRLATFRLNRWNPAYRFYVNRHVAILETDEDARRFFADPMGYYCVMTAQMSEELRRAGVPLKVVYQSDGLWATSGRMLWRRRGELTTFVVAGHDSQIARP